MPIIMDINRKVLMITRHCVTARREGEPADDASLTPESIQEMYHSAKAALRGFVIDHGVEPADVFVAHSHRRRTKYTGLTRVAGAYALQSTPSSHEDLDAMYEGQVPQIELAVDPRLAFEDMKFNEGAFQTQGDKAYIARWVGNPVATDYDGVNITPFTESVRRKGPCLVDALGRLIRGEKGLGVLATHAGVAESLIAAAVNSGRSSPVDNVDDIGGNVAREGFALIYLDGTPAGGCLASMVRDGRRYAVDLDRIGG